MFDLGQINAMLLAGIIAVVAGTLARIAWRGLSAASRDQRQLQLPADPDQLTRARRDREQRSHSMGALLRVLAVAVWPAGLAVIVAAQLAEPGASHAIVSGFTATVVPLASGLLWRRGRQLQLPIAERAPGGRQRPQVLYLRPFLVDRLDRHNRAGNPEMFPKTDVERMQRALRPIADLVSVGDPTDRLPPLGTELVYPPESWQEAVRELTGEASAVILPAYLIPEGPSGFAWEVEHVVGLGAPDRVIFLLTPPGVDPVLAPQVRDQYAAFRDRFGPLFRRGLPDAIGTSNVLYFDADWTPRLLAYVGGPVVEMPDSRADGLRTLVLRQLKHEFGNPRLERLQRFLQRRPPLVRVALIALILLAGLLAVMLFFALLLSLTLIGT